MMSGERLGYKYKRKGVVRTKMKESDWKKEKVIGRGYFSAVFLVRHKKTGKLFAMKKMKKDFIIKEDKIDKIMEEKRMCSSLKHKNIIHLYCSFQSKTYLFLIFEFANGGDLWVHIYQEGDYRSIPNYKNASVDGMLEKRAKFYAAEIFLALSFLHENGVIYRDLKPENILLDRHGHAKLCDLGLAKQIAVSRKGNINPLEVRTNTLVGTKEYYSPEQVSDCRYVNENKIETGFYTPAVDWWSFGIVLCEFVYGEHPVKEMYSDLLDKKLEKIVKEFTEKKEKVIGSYSFKRDVSVSTSSGITTSSASSGCTTSSCSSNSSSRNVSNESIESDEGRAKSEGYYYSGTDYDLDEVLENSSNEEEEIYYLKNSSEMNTSWYFDIIQNKKILLPDDDIYVIDELSGKHKILGNRMISSECDDLITKLLVKDPKKRLGYKNNKEIMNHPFFVGDNPNFWEDLKSGKLKPPMIPDLEDEMDLKYIDKQMLEIDDFKSVLDEQSNNGKKLKPRIARIKNRLFKGYSFYSSFGEFDSREVRSYCKESRKSQVIRSRKKNRNKNSVGKNKINKKKWELI